MGSSLTNKVHQLNSPRLGHHKKRWLPDMGGQNYFTLNVNLWAFLAYLNVWLIWLKINFDFSFRRPENQILRKNQSIKSSTINFQKQAGDQVIGQVRRWSTKALQCLGEGEEPGPWTLQVSFLINRVVTLGEKTGGSVVFLKALKQVRKISWRKKWQLTSPQCSCLGNPMGRGARQATVHGAAKVSDIP